METVPCKDCIRFDICNDLYINVGRSLFISDIKKQCDVIRKYINSAPLSYYENQIEIIKVFKLQNSPCKNCLTYAICRNQLLHFNKKDLDYVTTAYTIYNAYIINIYPKCSLIEEWLSRNKYDLRYEVIARCLKIIFKIKNYRR